MSKKAVAPFLISQCYNRNHSLLILDEAVAPFLISQCYNDICHHYVE